jgi:RHS repeat-associated protein
MVDAVGTTAYGYDAVGQLLSEDGSWASDTVNYTYQNRLRMGLSLQMPSEGLAWRQSYAYDLARRLTGVSSPAGSFGYIYDPVALQRVDELTLPNGAYVTNTFDTVARLTGTWLMNSSGTNLDSYVYSYNQASQRTSVLRTAGDSISYLYDGLGELTNAVAKEPGGLIRLPERLSYAYDAAGNLLQKNQNMLADTRIVYGINQLNEITSAVPGGSINSFTPWSYYIALSGSTTSKATNVAVNGTNLYSYDLFGDNTFGQNFSVNAGSNGYTVVAQDAYGRSSTNFTSAYLVRTNSSYVYDLNGNLLTDGARSFAYDDENQLISAWKTNLWRNDFVYDGKMRRRIERDYTWSGSAWSQTNEIHFVYDGNLVVQERDGNNTPQVTYTRGSDLSGTLQGAGGIGGLLARTDRSQVAEWMVTLGGGVTTFGTHSYYHADGNGNVTMLLSASQMIVAKYLYDPYGNTLAQSGLLADLNKYRFSSKEWNANSGLYYYLYRFYDPNLQRWLNRDPIGENGFEAVRKHRALASLGEPNRYQFVYNDPLSEYDPFGLISEADCEAEKSVCDLGCRDMPANTRWQRYLKQTCWAKCMTEYAACLGAVAAQQAACWCEKNPGKCVIIGGIIIIIIPKPIPVPAI